MSKISVLIIVLFFQTSLIAHAKDFSRLGIIKNNEQNQMIFVCADEKGLTREFVITNFQTYEDELALLSEETIKLKGNFQNKGKRQGALKIKKILSEHLNPLNL